MKKRGKIKKIGKPSVVKIDSEMLKKVEEFIKKEENKFKFVNKKQLVDIAVYEYLERSKKDGKK